MTNGHSHAFPPYMCLQYDLRSFLPGTKQTTITTRTITITMIMITITTISTIALATITILLSTVTGSRC